jgi:hypothetical protein
MLSLISRNLIIKNWNYGKTFTSLIFAAKIKIMEIDGVIEI